MSDMNNWISIIILIFIGYYYWKRTKFDPFVLRISPKWSLILQDYSGYDEEKVNQLIEKHKDDDSHILRKFMTFTVLKAHRNGRLIFYNNDTTFHSAVHFREVIDEVNDFGYSPYFHVREDVKGYKLGITTHKSGEKSDCFGDDKDLIEIATLPYAPFHIPTLRYGTINPRKLESRLKEFGWERVKSDDPTDNPVELNHKYFKVYYDHI